MTTEQEIDQFHFNPEDIPFKEMFDRLPIAIDWCKYKGEIVVAQINWEATKKAHKPMMDLSYCMTRALNQNIERTVQWDKNKFKPCHLSVSWDNQNPS